MNLERIMMIEEYLSSDDSINKVLDCRIVFPEGNVKNMTVILTSKNLYIVGGVKERLLVHQYSLKSITKLLYSVSPKHHFAIFTGSKQIFRCILEMNGLGSVDNKLIQDFIDFKDSVSYEAKNWSHSVGFSEEEITGDISLK